MVCSRQRASYLLVTAGVREGPVQSEGSRSSEQRNWEAGSAKERGNLTERDDLTSGTERVFLLEMMGSGQPSGWFPEMASVIGTISDTEHILEIVDVEIVVGQGELSVLKSVTLGTHVIHEEENTLRGRAAIPSADPQEEMLVNSSASKPSSDCLAQSEQTLGVLFEQRRKQNCHQDHAWGSQTGISDQNQVLLICQNVLFVKQIV